MCRDIAPVKLYFGLRDYGMPGQIGLEPTLAGYIETMVAVFREVRRVLHPTGVCFLNLGDSFSGMYSGRNDAGKNIGGRGGNREGSGNPGGGRSLGTAQGFKPKDLMMVPARVAIALQDDGWWLRSDIIWSKPNPMPESVRDRPTSAHEHIFLLTKNSQYYYDAEAVRTPLLESSRDRLSQDVEHQTGSDRANGGAKTNGTMKAVQRTDKQRGHVRRHDGFNDRWDAMSKEEQQANGANLRNVWMIATQGFAGAHFATFPPEIPRRCIKAGTSEKGCCAACGTPWRRVVERGELTGRGTSPGQPAHLTPQGYLRAGGSRCGDSTSVTLGWEPGCTCDADVIPCTVLDPFSGAGTVGVVCAELGRDYIGVELNPDYAEISRQRIDGVAPLFVRANVVPTSCDTADTNPQGSLDHLPLPLFQSLETA